MYEKALLIYNGAAGQADIGERLATLTRVLAPAINELILLQTKEKGDAERYCRERAEGVDLLLILGGDGTVHECVNGLSGLAHPPVVGVLPGGTCNDFSRTLRLPQQLAQAAETITEGRTLAVDIGVMNDRYFSNFYGIGLITDTSENINSELKGKIGKLSYFLSALQQVRAADTFAYELETDQGLVTGEAVMILVANGGFIGTNALPGDHDRLTDGLLDVYVIREAGLPLLMEVLSQKTGKPWDPESSSIDYLRSTRVRIRTEEPKRADTDGEVYMETPAELSLLPQHLTFIVGDLVEEDGAVE
ncbi:diacylglycerol/lipid kinase family protein [Paenibacillus sp. 1P07SE]|uniref:diacylglycerol/lipid kinase family protein n=1 Tax=Paenibacillus sp. 1P07SE TaxID=3132209 RepID=UPI0039A49DC3